MNNVYKTYILATNCTPWVITILQKHHGVICEPFGSINFVSSFYYKKKMIAMIRLCKLNIDIEMNIIYIKHQVATQES